MTKSEARKIYLQKQKSLSLEERAEKSRRIADRFFDNFDFAAVELLHCFIAIEKFSEIDTTPIFQRLWKDSPQIKTVVPRVDFESDEIRNLKFTPDTELVANVWDIHEPAHDEYIETEKVDMVLVPGLCFDSLGHRVGYGKGFYDRFLSKCRPDCVKIGLSYFEPVDRIGDVHEADFALDHLITPENIFTIEKRREEL